MELSTSVIDRAIVRFTDEGEPPGAGGRAVLSGRDLGQPGFLDSTTQHNTVQTLTASRPGMHARLHMQSGIAGRSTAVRQLLNKAGEHTPGMASLAAGELEDVDEGVQRWRRARSASSSQSDAQSDSSTERDDATSDYLDARLGRSYAGPSDEAFRQVRGSSWRQGRGGLRSSTPDALPAAVLPRQPALSERGAQRCKHGCPVLSQGAPAAPPTPTPRLPAPG